MEDGVGEFLIDLILVEAGNISSLVRGDHQDVGLDTLPLSIHSYLMLVPHGLSQLVDL